MSNFPASYWHWTQDGKIQCDLCPRACQLKDGQRGFCFVRAREKDQMVLSTYGRSSGFCIDPIEKKPLHHFLPGTPILSFGTAGCNMGCTFCQNWDISKSREMDKLSDTASPEALAKAAKHYGCRSIAYTYNDPVIFLEYAVDVSEAAWEYGIYSVAVTAGYIQGQAREDFFAHMHAANVDLKAFDPKFYRKYVNAHLEPVLETLEYIYHKTQVWLEITTLVIPTLNDSDQELHALTQWIVEHLGPEVPLHFSAFHPSYRLNHLPRTPLNTLKRARKIALDQGLHYVYTGNVYDSEGDTTFCPQCHRPLIVRDWYELKAWHLQDGHCPYCKAKIKGFFENHPGHWGARRLPLYSGLGAFES